MITAEFIQHTLKSRFGYDTFREHQLDIIRHVLNGEDALVIMPTGGGKSICYQLPALLKEGFTLVISPLISLMNDQVRSLKTNGIPAGALHSGTTPEESRHIYEQIGNLELKILYVSPERVLTSKFLEWIVVQKINLIAIDEAHCVSIWGNDFRPEYAQLPGLTSQLPLVPVLALTATADKATQEDIFKQLQLKSHKIFLSSFERPNIHLSVRPGVKRIEQIRDFIKQREGQPGIIYCLARKTTESIAEVLKRYGIKAEPYHADIDNRVRKNVQEDFQFNRIQIVCATIAFGMGIDKPDIRWIIHYNLPKNIENYYQEIGRSGRDGMPAEAVMYYSFGDVRTYRNFIFDSEANETFKRVQEDKLDRIWDYALAMNCRTNVILNYFGEYRSHACGHCDNCVSPPEGFDGTKYAQMALSACKRCEESVGVGMLVDVLRGSQRREIYDRRFHLIKTYGAGRDLGQNEWSGYITQMINQGLFEIDYTQFSVLKCTPLSDEVLFKGRKITLHRQAEKAAEPFVPRKTKSELFNEGLLHDLDSLTEQIARQEGVPAPTIFSKGTLKEMAEVRPFTMDEFISLQGIGEYKAKKYGQQYLDVIRNYMVDQKIMKKAKGVTYIETLNLYLRGLDIPAMAKERSMTEATIAGHLARLYEKGEDIDLQKFLKPSDLILAKQAWRASGYSDQISKIKEQVGDSLDYTRLHLAMAIVRKEKGVQVNTEKS